MEMDESKHGIAAWLTPKNLKTFGIVNLGSLLMAIGVYFFKFPNHFTTGGVSGISIILGELIPSVSTATMMSIINVLLLIVGFIFIGREFGFLTTYSSLIYSFETWLLEKIFPMDAPFTDQPLLELFFAIMLPAVGSALLFNVNASSGGTDIIAMIVQKYVKLKDIGEALLISDSVVAFSSCFIFDIKTGLFSMLGLFMKSFLVDSVIENINLCKFFSIVTSHPDEICDYIINVMHRSSTVLDAQGAYSHEDRKVILIACRRREAVKLQQKLRVIDPHAFMFITNTSEIIGKGFRSI